MMQSAELDALLLRGLRTMPMIFDARAALDELRDRLRDPDCGLYVLQGGFIIAENNRSAFVNACTVIHVYSERPGILPALLGWLCRFAAAGGMRRIHGVDINQSRAYRRLFKAPGWKARPIGTQYVFSRAV